MGGQPNIGNACILGVSVPDTPPLWEDIMYSDSAINFISMSKADKPEANIEYARTIEQYCASYY